MSIKVEACAGGTPELRLDADSVEDSSVTLGAHGSQKEAAPASQDFS